MNQENQNNTQQEPPSQPPTTTQNTEIKVENPGGSAKIEEQLNHNQIKVEESSSNPTQTEKSGSALNIQTEYTTAINVNNGPSSSGSLEIKIPQGNQNQVQKPMLSPKSLSGSRRAQSPGVYKGKLQTVKKLLAKQQEKYNVINLELTSVKSAHQTLLKEWQAKQSQANEQILGNQNSEDFAKQIGILQHSIHSVNEQLGKAKLEYDQKLQTFLKEKEDISVQIQKSKGQLQNSKRLFEENKAKEQENLKHIKETITLTEQRVTKLANQKKNDLKQLEDLKSKKSAIETNKQKVSVQIRLNLQKAGNQQKQAEIRKQQLQKRIAQAKERINQRKKQLNDLQGKENNKSNDKSKLDEDIKHAKAQNYQLAQAVKKAEEANSRKAKDVTENREAEKKKQKKLTELKAKIDEANKKKIQLKEQIVKLDTLLQEKKVVKYEQKVPEQLFVLRAKNEQIRKDIKKILEKNEIQKSQLGQLVPPTVIQNMNKKISTTIANNEKLSEISKIIEQVSLQTQKLASEREALQWGDNNNIKELEKERKKQQQKNKILEDEVAQKKRSIQQQQAKLKEYTLAYPQFKPEKKKKSEPEKVKKEQKGKKGGSVIVEQQKQIDMKKKKSANEIVNKSEIVAPIVEQPKKQKAGKKKKKNQESDEKLQKSPSPQASPQPKVQVKSQPKIEQKPPVKVEAKQQVKPEPKTQSKIDVKEQTKAQIKVEPKQQMKKQQKQVKGEGQPKKKKQKK